MLLRTSSGLVIWDKLGMSHSTCSYVYNYRYGVTNSLMWQLYRGAGTSLARPGRKQATATENWSNISIIYIPYFPAHKTHRDFLVRNFRKKNDECILILVIYWKETGLLHTKISNHNIIYSSYKPRKSLSLPLKSSSWLFSLSHDKDVV